ncbi:hypothetical protein AGMMS49941_11980 [Deferribacterales bacterium]|nr:hypothetical protein AGMMS49941_11980 [Deferribacterales bacterium]
MSSGKTNREYKDSVFTKLFSEKEKLVELYNAIAGASYEVSDGIVINTLENVLFKGRRNDISFTMGDKLVILLEHQSTINNNMPLRFLGYIVRMYEGMIDSKSIYKSKRLTLPRPEFIVLYNGVESLKADDYYVKLSALFAEDDTRTDTHNFLELEARVLNVNKGHNGKVLKASGTLGDYAEFVEVVRQETRGVNSRDKVALSSAMERAIKICIERGILRDFLHKHSVEVFNMLTMELTQEDAEMARYEEGLEQGLEQGLQRGEQRGKLDVAKNLLTNGYPVEDVADLVGLSLAEVKKLQNDIIV